MRLTNKRNEFSGAWLARPEAATDKKAILISGTARGGTSFAASALLRLGVPFSRPDHRREVSKRTHEHKALRDAFKAGDGDRLKEIADDFSRSCDVWAWKLPQIHEDFDLIQRCIANPHFVFIFKEPVSIAFRRNDVKGSEFLEAMNKAIDDYTRLVRFATAIKAPVLFIGYDTAMSSTEAFLAEAAKFAGVRDYDEASVIEKIEADAAHYYPGGSSGQAEAEAE